MIRRLDGHLARRAVISAGLLALALVVVFIVVDALANLSVYTKRTGLSDDQRLLLILRLYAERLPQLLNFAAPIAAVGAAMLVCAPMLRRGEFTALGAGGIGPRTATRALVLLALLVGAVDAVIADRWTPHATARANAIEDQLREMSREGRSWISARDGTAWFAGSVSLLDRPDGRQPSMAQVAAASGDALIYAGSATWRGGRWILGDGIVRMQLGADGSVACDRPASLDATPLGLDEEPRLLYRLLLPRFTMSSAELVERDMPGDLGVVWARWLRLLLPASMVLVAMPLLVRFANRDRLMVASVQAVAAAAAPAAIILVGGIATEAARTPFAAAAVTAVAAAIPGAWLWLRWRL